MTRDFSESSGAWAVEEFGEAMLTDVRNVRRVVTMAEQLLEHPSASVSGAFRTAADARAAYDFLEHSTLEWQDVADASHRACAARCADQSMVLVMIDGSSWTYTDKAKNKGFGPIGSYQKGARGIKVMTAYAVAPNGIPLGVIAQELWKRSEQRHEIPHEKRALEDKESRYWTMLQKQTEAQLHGTKTVPWYQMDREADQISVLLRTLDPNVLLTVRADHNRCLAEAVIGADGNPIRLVIEQLDEVTAQAVTTVAVRRSAKRSKRMAQVELSFVDVPLKLRQQWSKKVLGVVEVTAIRVRERASSCPAREEPLDWLLYTTYPVTNVDDALRVVQAYALRWRIERLHYTTKTGAGNLPDSQLRSFSAMAMWITLHVAVAARLQHILHRARVEPDVSAREEFSVDEIEATLILHKRRHTKRGQTYSDEPTLSQLVIYIAQIGGFFHTKQNPWPGIVTFERGFIDVLPAAYLLTELREQGRVLPSASVEGNA